MAALPTFTLDLEDHRPDDSFPVRFPDVTRTVLDWLEERNVAGTFFVVGDAARAEPDLVREVAGRGHEVALHAWRHVPLTELDAARFEEETRKGKELLEDLAGAPVVGYRAPTFSLVPETRWAVGVLCSLGFTYSSSVLAAPNPLFGWPGAPAVPFRWPEGLTELPTPLAGVARWRIPYLGGTYLRLLPAPVVAAAVRLVDAGPVPWIYCHPYDFDPDEPFWPEPTAGRLARLLWVGRRGLFRKLDRLLADGAAPPLGERLAAADDGPAPPPTTRTLEHP